MLLLKLYIASMMSQARRIQSTEIHINDRNKCYLIFIKFYNLLVGELVLFYF